ncbi:hypothetical protein FACS189474_2940 [Bacteroidia bacterium]|nr:hypothetical protein FACS189474_2940 [Bacteroidia bacterium]
MEIQVIQNKICEIRGLKVILDKDLAEMYGVSTSNLNKAVKRNLNRFPEDFMFQLNNNEFDLIFQNGTSSWGGTRKLSYAFTEHGVAMLAGLLNSPKAIEVNIYIVRAFVALRKYVLGYAELKQQLDNYMVETNSKLSLTDDLEKKFKALEQANEDLLKDINDLSEDTRNNFDDVYISLTQLAEKQKVISEKENQPRPKIGYIRYDDE